MFSSYSTINSSKNSSASSTVLFNPDEGVTHLLLTLQLPAPSPSVSYAGLALNRGWGYNAIRRIGVRYAGSTLYYFANDQELIDCLADCEDSSKKDILLLLGGQSMLSAPSSSPGAGDFADASKRTAYVYIKLPHNTPSAQEASLPLPTDALTAPIQVNIEFKSANEIFTLQNNTIAGGSSPVLPSAFDVAQVQWRQIHFDDRSEQLSRRHNLAEMAYSYPLKYFAQEVFRVQNVEGGTNYPVTLTGMRSGNMKGIRIWCKPNNEANALKYVSPNSIELSVNGLIYFSSRYGQQQLWNLVERKTSASFTMELIAPVLDNGVTKWVATPSTGYWIDIPFAQQSEVLANESELTHGLSIMNSIVNLNINLPAGSANDPDAIAAAVYNALKTQAHVDAGRGGR